MVSPRHLVCDVHVSYVKTLCAKRTHFPFQSSFSSRMDFNNINDICDLFEARCSTRLNEVRVFGVGHKRDFMNSSYTQFIYGVYKTPTSAWYMLRDLTPENKTRLEDLLRGFPVRWEWTQEGAVHLSVPSNTLETHERDALQSFAQRPESHVAHLEMS